MTSTTTLADLSFLVQNATLDELRLRPPAAGHKVSADVMLKKPGRPPIGVQGMILDAMDDGSISRAEASQLLIQVDRRLHPGGQTLCRVLPNGDVVAMATRCEEVAIG